MSESRMYAAFEDYLTQMGQNAPKDAGEREIFRRLFIAGFGAGWEAAEDVSASTHFLRLIRWQ